MESIKPELNYSRTTSFLIVTIAYVVAIAIALMVIDIIKGIYHPLITIAIADFVATVVVFVFSFRFKNSSIYDPYWSVIPPLIAVYFMLLFPEGNLVRQLLTLGVISFWAIRLTRNWAVGWTGLEHEDWRYGQLAEQSGRLYWLVSFLGIHFFPTVMVFLGCIPVYYLMESSLALTPWDYVGAVVAIVATLIELRADEQLRVFKQENQDPTAIMDKGLWAYSRHPNYFGEITFWGGLFIMAVGMNFQEYLWTGVGFLAMVILFQFISIPMMEKRHRAKRPQYEEYQRRVSRLVPWVRKDKLT